MVFWFVSGACLVWWFLLCSWFFFFSSRRRHTRCALVTGVQTCALPISQAGVGVNALHRAAGELQRVSAGVWWDRLKEWITAALIGLGLIFAAALAYRW